MKKTTIKKNNNNIRNNASKFLIVLPAMFGVLTGCGRQEEKYIRIAENNLTNNLKEVMKADEVDLQKFEILAVEVGKTGFNFDVVFNGVATYGDENQKAYATADYKVASKYFTGLNTNSSTEKMFDTFNIIINEHAIQSYSLTPISEFLKINNALAKNTLSPFEGYTVRSGLAYNISMPVYNDETKEISFDVEMLTKLINSSTDLGIGIGFPTGGGIGIGIGPTFSQNKSLVNVTDNYTIDATTLNYEVLKTNPQQVLDYFTECLLQKDASKISGTRRNVNIAGYQNANVMGHIKFEDVGKTL